MKLIMFNLNWDLFMRVGWMLWPDLNEKLCIVLYGENAYAHLFFRHHNWKRWAFENFKRHWFICQTNLKTFLFRMSWKVIKAHSFLFESVITVNNIIVYGKVLGLLPAGLFPAGIFSAVFSPLGLFPARSFPLLFFFIQFLKQ